jgi:hypothetical protein
MAPYEMKLTIYKDLGKAELSSSVKKDKGEVNIFFDKYTVKEWIGNLFKITFYKGEALEVGLVEIKLKNVLEVGFGPVTTKRFSTEPTHYISINDQKAIDRGDKTLEECIREHNPSLADFLFLED